MKIVKTHQKRRSSSSSSSSTTSPSLLSSLSPSLARTVLVKPHQAATFSSLLLLIIVVVGGVSCVVVYQVRFIATKNGRTDHAVAGESIELSCHYIMKDEVEEVKQLVWSKDGKNFLKWRKNKPGLEVLSYIFKGHVDPQSKHSHITIHNVTIGMHGKYKCSVKTDLGVHEMEQDLVVISQSNCKLNDWRVASHPGQCRESFKLDCRNMFPKPVPSCGLWNAKLEKFIRSVMVDISEEANKPTYRVHYADKFDLRRPDGSVNPAHADLLQYAGHLMFKCDIIVPETSWKMSLVHRMFDYDDGCLQDPLETIERLRMNYSHYATRRMQQAGYLLDRQLDEFDMLTSSLEYELIPSASTQSYSNGTGNKLDLNCWQKPRYGTLAKLSCASKGSQARLTGANMLECQPTGWMPINGNQLPPKPLVKKIIPRTKKPPPQTRSSGREPSDLDYDYTATEANTISPGNHNDLEESGTKVPITTSMLSTEVELIPTTTSPLSREDVTPTPNHQQSHSQWPELTPRQLATLLPSCVSTRRYIQHSTAISNRLPLLDEDYRVVGASTPNIRQQPSSSDRDRSILSFSFSSATRSEVPSVQLFGFNIFIAFLLYSILTGQVQRYQFVMLSIV